jgi:hypothetical protein
MARLSVNTALVVPSQAIDDYPVWSPDSRYVVANVMGTWQRVDLKSLALAEAYWHESKIGVIAGAGTAPLTPDEERVWLPNQGPDPQVAQAKTIRVEFRQDGLATEFVVTRSGQPRSVVWRTDLENCYSPVIAPSEAYVAYICEQNGLLVMSLKRPPA